MRDKKMFTVSQLADLSGLSRGTIWKKINEGKLKAEQTEDKRGTYLVSLDEAISAGLPIDSVEGDKKETTKEDKYQKHKQEILSIQRQLDNKDKIINELIHKNEILSIKLSSAEESLGFARLALHAIEAPKSGNESQKRKKNFWQRLFS